MGFTKRQTDNNETGFGLVYLKFCLKVKNNSQRFEIVVQFKFLCDFLLEFSSFAQVFVLVRKDDIDQILGCCAVHKMIAPELHPLSCLR